MPTPSFNWEETLRLSNNKADLAKDLTTLLAKDLPVFQKDLKQAFQQKDMKKIQHLAHKFHGACCYCSIPKLKPLLKTLEDQCKTQPIEAQKPLIETIDREVHQVLIQIKRYL